MLNVFNRIKIDKYFFVEEHPYTKKRKFRPGRIKVLLVFFTCFAITFVLVFGAPSEEERMAEVSRTETRRKSKEDPYNRNTPSGLDLEARLAPRERETGLTQRQFSASQLVKKNDPSNSTDKLPMGTTISAHLSNNVLSSDQDSPVIAEIDEDVYWQNAVLIPKSTKAIGQGNLDDTTERLRTRFHTLVYPDGSQHQIQGLALLPDGSSGLTGNYSSGKFRKHSGQLLGNFIGGMAQGLKERKAEGQAGFTHEPGNLKNGVLNGVAASSLGYAESHAEDIAAVRPYLAVQTGSAFLIYLEREYSP